MRRSTLTRGATVIVGILLAGLTSLSFAQHLEEIVVTAQKREQNIQNVGIAITALSGSLLSELNLTSTSRLGTQVPGLIVTDIGNPVTTVFNIRGVSQNDFADHEEPPVAVYVDGAYVPYLGAVGMNMFDLQRVEVLKGPQGTLFGRNATGGVVRLISRPPTDKFEAYAKLTFGEYDQVQSEGAVSGPLTDKLLGRLSFSSNYHDGPWVDKNGPANKGDAENYNLRGQLLYLINDDAKLLLNLRASHNDTNDSPWVARPGYFQSNGLVGSSDFNQFRNFCESYYGFTGLGSLIPKGAVDCFSGLAPVLGLGPAFIQSKDPFKINHDRNGGLKTTSRAATARLTWNLGSLKLVSITDYEKFDKNYGPEDTDATPYRLLEFFQSEHAWNFSQELRLSGQTARTRWVAGFYYLDINGHYNAGTNFYPALAFLGLNATISNDYALKTETWALFGQGEYDIAHNLTVIGGFRWTQDNKKFEFNPYCAGLLCALLAVPGTVQYTGYNSSTPGADTHRNSGNWSGKLELDWHPNDNWLVYAGVTRGLKAGSFNGGSYAPWTPSQEKFKDEILTDYEGGFKATLFNDTTRFNATAFYYDYKNIQVFTFQGTSLYVFNRNGEMHGAEFELTTRPAEGWNFNLGLSLLDTKVDGIQEGFLGPRNTQMMNSPHVTANGLGRYEWPAFNGKMALQLDFNWVGKRKLNIVDHPATAARAYFLLNGDAEYSMATHWKFKVFVQNLTDERYIVTSFQLPDITGSIIDIYGFPRWVGGSVTYNW